MQTGPVFQLAYAYGLTRDQYAHVLSTFSHSSVSA